MEYDRRQKPLNGSCIVILSYKGNRYAIFFFINNIPRNLQIHISTIRDNSRNFTRVYYFKSKIEFHGERKKKKKQDRYFVPSKPPLRSTNFKVAGILSRTSQLYFGCIIFWNLFFCSFRIPEMKHSC